MRVFSRAVAALLVLGACTFGRPTDIETAMLSAARQGAFPLARAVHGTYTGDVECRVDTPHAFEGADIYLCALSLTDGGRQWEWGAMQDGNLHTHLTNPDRIPTVPADGWDPPW
jgi:hypothetical protein